MDYYKLADEFFESVISFNKFMRNVNFNEGIQGENLILDIICKKQDHVVPGDISEEICVSSPRIAAVLNSLEKKGYIEREIDKNDRRRVLIKARQEGYDAARNHRDKMSEHIRGIFVLLGEDDSKEYVRIMKKLALRLGEKSECKKLQ